MRVLHVGKFYPPYPGGIECAVAGLADAQASQGTTVAVLAHAPPGQRRHRAYQDGGVAVVEAGCWGQLVYAPISPDFPVRLNRLIRHFRPDLLHLHVPNTSAFAALALPAARALPWVVHWHADIPLDGSSRLLRTMYPLYRPFERALLARAAAIVATSGAYADASQVLKAWREKVAIIPLGLAATNTPAADTVVPAWPAPGLRLLAVGRLSHYKGFEVLLEALAGVPEASLVLVGRGEREAALRERIARLGLASRVRMAGAIDDAALLGLYAQADAFCLPSLDRAEAFGVVLLEAMRARLPVIASDIPGSGVGFVAQDGETGLLLPPGDVGALAEAIRRLIGDMALRRRLGMAGERRWREHFSLEQMAESMDQLYRLVLAARPDRAGPAGPA